MKSQTSKAQYVVIFADLFSNDCTESYSNSIPTQFSDVFRKGKSTLEKTYDFYAKFIDRSNIYVATTPEMNSISTTQLKSVNSKNFLVVPENKNAASSIAYLAFKLFKLNNESNIIFSPCDISSEDESALIDCMKQALELTSKSEALIVLGSKPINYQSKTEYFAVQTTSNGNQLYPISGRGSCTNLRFQVDHSDKKSLFINSKVIIGKSFELIDMYREYDVEDFIAFHGVYDYLNTDKEMEAVDYAFQNCRSLPFEDLLLKNSKNLWLKEVKMNIMNHNLLNKTWSLFNMNTPNYAGHQI